MPTTEDLQRLQALLKSLEPLGDAQRGELILAEDWNALVSAVAEIARSVLAADSVPVIPPHEHLDQVTQAWLAQQLRDLIEKGPLSDPAMQGRLSNLELTLKRLSDRVDASANTVDDFRGRLTDVSTHDLERQADVTRVSRALDNVVDPRPDLQAFRNTLSVVQKDLSTVQEAASKLVLNGQVIDVGQIAGKVSALETFRDGFKAANGEILDAAAIERRFSEISVGFVRPEDLNNALKDRQFEISAEQLTALEGRLTTNITDQVNSKVAGFRGEVLGEVDGRFGTVGDLVGARLNDALPGVTQSVTSNLQPRIDAARQAAVDAAVTAAQQSITARESAVRTDFNAQLSDLRASVQLSVRAEVAQSIASQLTGLQTSVANALDRLDAISTRAAKADDLAQSQAAAIARLTQDAAALKNDIRTSLLSEIDLRFQAANRTIDDKIAAFSKTQNDRLDVVTRDITNQALDEARRVANETASNATASTRAQLMAEMRAIAREEAGSAVRDQVKVSVADAVKEQFTTIPGLISQEVRRTVGTGGGAVPIRPGLGNVIPGGGTG